MCVRSYSSADLLAMVDNYGLLCLDIAWTYFKLQDINNLKDAGWRLQKVHERHGLSPSDIALSCQVLIVVGRRLKSAWRRRTDATWSA